MSELDEILKNLTAGDAALDKSFEEPSSWATLIDTLGPISWEWPGWLASGFLHVIASEPGEGKSALCLRLAGCYLLGWDWPDGTPFRGDHGKVLWCEAESAQAVNLDRARKWGLPIENILTPLPDPLEDVSIRKPPHQEAIQNLAANNDVRIVVLDSLSGSTLGHREDDSTMIGPAKFLAQVARDTGKPVLVTHHLRKRGLLDIGGDTPSLDRVRGSSSIVQPARLVWALDKPDPTAKERGRLSVIKSNLARFPSPIGFEINGDGITFGLAPEAPHTETVVDRAADLLRALLGDEPMRSTEIQAEFDQAGISWRSANEAKKRLGVVAVRKEGAWFWSLPVRD